MATKLKTRLKVFNETHWYEINKKDEWILYEVTELFFNDFGINKDSGAGAFRPCK